MLRADKGVEVTIDGNSYVVTSTSGTKTVTYGGADAATGNVTTVKIPAIVQINGQTYKITAVDANAFKNDTKIKTVIMGPNVTKIGDNAFYGCKNLSKVTLSSKTVSIGKNAFYKCTKLSAITIPATVKTIGTKAFYGCSKLKTITIKSKKLTSKNVGSSAFKGIYNKAKIKVPKAKWCAYKTLIKKKGVSSKAAFKKL